MSGLHREPEETVTSQGNEPTFDRVMLGLSYLYKFEVKPFD